MKVSELTRILSDHGCFMIGHGTKHDKWQSSLNGKCFYVPRHPAKELKNGTVKAILEQAGIELR